MSGPLIILAAGGTGGHVFPAEALAAELGARGCVLALMTDNRGDAYGGRLGGLQTYTLSAGSIAGRGLFGRINSLIKLAVGSVQAWRLLRHLKPDAVVGFGGYPSIPPMMAATFAGIDTVIHEQNAVLGRANRLLAGRVGVLALSHDNVRFLPPKKTTIVQTGNPVRPAILVARDQAYTRPESNGVFRLFIIGGSQGAAAFSAVVPDAVGRLDAALRSRLKIAQQCRPEDLEATENTYRKVGVEADLRSFFDDVPAQMAAAHLVVSRAGASSVAEIAAIGRPSILVPYAHATDDHQTDNARSLVANDAAWLLPQSAFSAKNLAARLTDLLQSPDMLAESAANARAVGRPEAAVKLADCVMQLTAATAEKRSAA